MVEGTDTWFMRNLLFLSLHPAYTGVVGVPTQDGSQGTLGHLSKAFLL